MKHTLVCFLCLSVSCVATAQDHFQKGIVITNNGDTLKGWIDYKIKRKNPVSFDFYKKNQMAAAIKYRASDIRYVEISGVDIFVSAIVNASAVSENIDFGETVVAPAQDTVFLRALSLGENVNLYELTDSKQRFFIREGERAFEELKLVKKMNDGYEMELPVFRNQLTVLASRYDKLTVLTNQINSASYTEYSLKNIINEINDSKDAPVYRVTDRKVRFHGLINAGACISSMRIVGDTYTIGDLSFTGSVTPYISAGVELSELVGSRFRARLEMAYFSAKYDGHGSSFTSTGKVSYSVKQTTIAPLVSAQYDIVKTGPFAFWGGAGFGVHFSSYSGNEYHQTLPELTLKDYIDFKQGWIAINLRVGARIAERWEIGVNRRIIDDFANGTTRWKLKTDTYYTWIGYRFGGQ